jgi:WD40 repeat protein
VRLWDTGTGASRVVWRLKEPNSNVTALCFAAGGHLLAVAHHLGGSIQIDLLDLRRGEVRATLCGHRHFIFALAFAPDGATLASGCADHTVKLWDAATGAEQRTLLVEPPLPDDLRADVRALAFSPDGRTLAAGWAPSWGKGPDQTCRVSLWDVATGTRLPAELRPGCAIASLAFAPDGRTLAAGCGDGFVRLWDTEPTTEFLDLVGTQPREAWSVAFSPDGLTLAVGYDDEQGGDRETLQLWDVRTGRVRANLHGHGSMVYKATFTPDGRTVASAGYDGAVKLWDAPTDRLRQTLDGHTDRVRSVACSPDGQTLASAGNDLAVRLWDLGTGRLRAVLQGHTYFVYEVVFAPDGQTVASASGDGTVRLWDTTTGQTLRILTDTSPVNSLAYTPEGRTLASANKEGIVRLWDVTTGQERMRLQGYKGLAYALAYSPDGKTLASSGEDRAVRLWQAATGRALLAFEDLPERVNDLAFSRDGRSLAASLHNGTVRVWRAAAADE